jgi:hypothetical protein
MFDCLVINDLDPFTFIASTPQELTFEIYDDAGNAINLVGTKPYWVMSPYGNPQYATLTIDGVISGSVINNFKVTISGSSTINLQGKYTHQPVVKDISGREYLPSQGTILIVGRNATV